MLFELPVRKEYILHIERVHITLFEKKTSQNFMLSSPEHEVIFKATSRLDIKHEFFDRILPNNSLVCIKTQDRGPPISAFYSLH